MADNIQVTAGSGTTVATDDISSVHYPRVKLSLGADGSAVDAVAGAGAVGTGVQRVTLASDDPVTTAVQIIDDWDESDRAKVNLIVGQAGIAAGAGAVGATVPRVTLASDDPVTTAVQIMDDWDESDRAKVNPIVGQAGITGGAGNVEANTPRVTLAADDPLVASKKSFLIRVSPTVTAGAYTATDVMGGEQTLSNAALASGGGGRIQSIMMVAKDDASADWAANDVDVLVFDSNPGGTYTDNATLDSSSLTDADAVGKLVAVVPLTVKAALGNVTTLSSGEIELPYVCVGSANLFAVAVNRGGKTPDATDAVTFVYRLVRD